ncbi:signal recognition particle-docking protein FtsY [Levilactobacillus tujiorum]|uniref:Signal recognition particle receptor FtsY n=1 Tax=Levilactobacillus tujiorum TaxID=2912243 RepID=A0ABX1L4Q4_9LACO|nr:signal recognition particle-docking protein FtsY [Levilactobacillus tujiorum]MCH5465011.1 signal recognition particle-docking protein FtsY [Levilactobacillus tujiorum]NLR12038.1 signal recognition particle-docking protein FtsY [Lactobacillus sp. HBUAS51387]NLR30013.1 signal recognition particle-docking protein FtsY [Levilactobacillus tujiorum]
MGLFDIFRRRAKKEPESEAPQTTVPSSATVEPVSSAAPESSVSDASASAAATSAAETPAPDAPGSEASATSASADGETIPASETAPDSSAAEAPVKAPASSATEEAPHSAAIEQPTSAASVAPEVVDSAVSEPTTSAATTDVTEAPTSSAVTSVAAKTVADSQGESEPTSAVTTEEHPATEDEQPVSDEQLYDKGLEKTRHTFGERLNALLANFRHVDESFFDDLEETLIGADVGFDMAVKLSDELRDEVKLQNAKKSADVQNVVVEKLVEIYDEAGNNESTALNIAKEGPTVILFVGVNGVGKTTTIGKMANRYHQAGKKVLLAAADTFRAGATEQLDVWAKRADVDIVTGKPQSDPAAVVFDAVQKAKREDYDILFVDTAGRLQNKVNLMNELAKMKRIITREIPTAPHEVLLVLDATTGQNALTQAKLFKESTDVTGIVLTKLDGTARGGIVLAIRNELHVPVKFIGLGEQISDLRPFDPNEFVYGLFKGLIDVKALEK